MNELEEPSVESLAGRSSKLNLNTLIQNPNFDAEHCDSATLFKIDSVELNNELERVKRKIQQYEAALKDRPLEFVGYANIKKKEVDEEAKAGDETKTKEQIKSESNKQPTKDQHTGNKEDDESNYENEVLSNEYDLNELKRNIYNAVASGKLEKAEHYLDMPGADINMTWYSENLLMCAIRNNHEKMAEFLIRRGVDVNFETELYEFKEDQKQFTYTNYSCREMAYTRGMHNLVSLIDIFHNSTDDRIVKYLSKKFVKQAQIQQSYENLSTKRSGSGKVGKSLYEKRIQAYGATQLFIDNITGEAFETSQLLLNEAETNSKNAAKAAAANMTHSDMASLLNEIDKVKPNSGVFIEEDELGELRSDKLTAHKNRAVVSSQTIESNKQSVNKSLADLVMDKLKYVERVQEAVRNDSKLPRKLNNKKSINYGQYTVDLVVKDLPTQTPRSDENSINSDSMELLRPLKSAASQKPPPSQRRQRIQSSKSNMEINMDKECEIVEVFTGARRNEVDEFSTQSPHGSKPTTPGSKLAASIPHMVPQTMVSFNPNEKFYAKKPRAESPSIVVMRPIIKSGTSENHLAKLNNFYYLQTLQNTNRTATKHLVDELNKREREPAIFPLHNSSRPSTNKTVRIAPSVLSASTPSPRKSSRDFKSRSSVNSLGFGSENIYYQEKRVSKLSKETKQPQQRLVSPWSSNPQSIRNAENQIMAKYLESLKQGGLYTQNSKPIVRNILANASNKKWNKLQRS